MADATQKIVQYLDEAHALRGDEPWPGYDELTVDQIRAALGKADDERTKARRASTSARTRAAPACSSSPTASSRAHSASGAPRPRATLFVALASVPCP